MKSDREDIRWIQRFSNYKKAFLQLEKFLAIKNLNEFERQGMIKAFEYTYELSWKTLQDLLEEKGYQNIVGPKPVIQQSFQDGYILNGEGWMKMHISRNLTSHTYNEDTALEISNSITQEYFYLFKDLFEKLLREENKLLGK
jgi:nucleotidyltransferase substrate binding protein (TIGR01987 family)